MTFSESTPLVASFSRQISPISAGWEPVIVSSLPKGQGVHSSLWSLQPFVTARYNEFTRPLRVVHSWLWSADFVGLTSLAQQPRKCPRRRHNFASRPMGQVVASTDLTFGGSRKSTVSQSDYFSVSGSMDQATDRFTPADCRNLNRPSYVCHCVLVTDGSTVFHVSRPALDPFQD